MKRAVGCSLSYKAMRFIRWAFLILPICFCGCFDSQKAKTQTARENGITAALGRFFTYGQKAPVEAASEAAVDSRSIPLLPEGISAPSDLAQDAAEGEIALPDFISTSRSAGGSLTRFSAAGNRTISALGRRWALNSGDAASLSILNSSFNQLFSSVFKQKNDTGAQAAREDLPNPFTEERLKRESSASKTPAEAPETKQETADKSEPKAQENSEQQPPAEATPVSAGSGNHGEVEFLILGDFDGSGRLSMLAARRLGDTIFLSEDGERDLNLYVNTSAVEQKRAFYVDDVDGNGTVDLLATSASSVLGAVLLGDGSGGYRLSGTFPTKYEPTVPMAGPVRNGLPEILTLNARTGALNTFLPTDRYRLVQTANLSFLPDYLLHLVEQNTSRDLVMAAQTGGMEQILGWGGDGFLQPVPDRLGANALTLSGSFKYGSLQVYQVGGYASLLLKSQGSSFNVANLRVMPRVVLVLGDFFKAGSLDVAVGALSSFTSKK